MTKAADKFVEEVKALLASDDGWRWSSGYLDFAEHQMTIWPDGNVQWWMIGYIPLEWTQRRSVARAYRRAHARIMDALIRKGLAAK